MKQFFIICAILLCLAFPRESQDSTLDTNYVNTYLTSKVMQDYHCLVEVIHFEAKGEGKVGMQAVASVVLNRTKARGFPSSVCGVVQQPKQFSYRNHVPIGKAVKTAYKPSEALTKALIQEIAFEAAVGRLKPVLDRSVVFYHAVSVKKNLGWNNPKKFVIKYGNHKFYRG